LGELARLVGGSLEGDGRVEIYGVAGIREAGPGDITFVANPSYEQYVSTTRAAAVIASPDLPLTGHAIRLENPYYAYLQVLEVFAHEAEIHYPRGVHQTAVVDESAVLGDNVAIGPFCQVCTGVSIGSGTTVLAGTFIGQGVSVGPDCLIYPNVTVREGSQIGCRVILHPGVVIGSDGFGFARNGGETNYKVAQIGTVEIEDDVEIGANSCVDRATTGKTRIGRGTKIDNLVQIAHNVVIGKNSVIAAQVGISGSTELGENVTLAGQSGLVGHIQIGDNAVVGAQGGVTRSVPANTVVSGYPAREHGFARRVWACSARLPELFKRVRDLERIIRGDRRERAIDSSAKDD